MLNKDDSTNDYWVSIVIVFKIIVWILQIALKLFPIKLQIVKRIIAF